MQSFLMMINKWWIIVDFKTRFSADPLTSAIVKDDGKVELLQWLADWFSSWSKTRSGLCLSQQTFQATVPTQQAQAHLVTDLLQEGYEFVISAKFQSEPIEQRFSQYRQMSGGNFLVSLREVLNKRGIEQQKNCFLRITVKRRRWHIRKDFGKDPQSL